MGLLIVLVVGATLGWLSSIVIDREDRTGTASCVIAGALGALVAAVLAGEVPLLSGVSPAQLLFGVLGSLVAIAVINIWQGRARSRVRNI
ncbi:hypothetical protein [Qipengyuania sp.]|uniref:hypothetical protein n=1 Tax=Qipengyuania sp. TaxID=2004515 RepID=UPI0035C806AA